MQESEKSKKTVASMIERPAERAAKLLKEKEQQQKMLKQQQPTKKSTASKKEKESALIIRLMPLFITKHSSLLFSPGHFSMGKCLQNQVY